jgi:hypothetical protein
MTVLSLSRFGSCYEERSARLRDHMLRTLPRMNALPMLRIIGGGSQQGGVVAEVAEPTVASQTKQGPQHVGQVGMIDEQHIAGLAGPSPADRTKAVLPRRHRVDVLWRETVEAPKPLSTLQLGAFRLGCWSKSPTRVDLWPVCLGPLAIDHQLPLPIFRIGCVSLLVVATHVRRPSVSFCSGLRPSWLSRVLRQDLRQRLR